MHIGKIVSLQQDGLSATMKAWKGSAEDVPGGTPVSYTHLDVYKRQR